MIFEPCGLAYTLQGEDWLRVTVSGHGQGDIEVARNANINKSLAW